MADKCFAVGRDVERKDEIVLELSNRNGFATVDRLTPNWRTSSDSVPIGSPGRMRPLKILRSIASASSS